MNSIQMFDAPLQTRYKTEVSSHVYGEDVYFLRMFWRLLAPSSDEFQRVSGHDHEEAPGFPIESAGQAIKDTSHTSFVRPTDLFPGPDC